MKDDIKKEGFKKFCTAEIFDDSDMNEWENVDYYEKYFQCARLTSSKYKTYVVSTYLFCIAHFKTLKMIPYFS